MKKLRQDVRSILLIRFPSDEPISLRIIDEKQDYAASEMHNSIVVVLLKE